jgi:ParB family chromosome partitioning protein
MSNKSTSDQKPTGPSAKKKGLGKGLGALIPDREKQRPVDVFFTPQSNLNQLTEDSGGYFQEIAIADIRPNPRQPRKIFDEDELYGMSENIKEVGVLQPIRVQQKSLEGQTYFELIMGERRKRAAELAGLTKIPAIVQFTENDELLRLALIENIHRVNLSPLEEAAAYQQMMQDFGYKQSDLAKHVAKSRSLIGNTLRLLNLPPKAQALLDKGEISRGHAIVILELDDPKEREALAEQVAREHLSVRETEQIVKAPTVVSLEKGVNRISPPKTDLISDYENSLEEFFNTRVRIKTRGTKQEHGLLSIEFGSIEDLERIIDLISSDLTDLV